MPPRAAAPRGAASGHCADMVYPPCLLRAATARGRSEAAAARRAAGRTPPPEGGVGHASRGAWRFPPPPPPSPFTNRLIRGAAGAAAVATAPPRRPRGGGAAAPDHGGGAGDPCGSGRAAAAGAVDRRAAGRHARRVVAARAPRASERGARPDAVAMVAGRGGTDGAGEGARRHRGGSGGGGGGGAPVPDGRVGFSFPRLREAVLDGKLDGVTAVAGLCAACPLTALTLPGVAPAGLPVLLTRAAGGRPLPRGRHLWPPRRAGRRHRRPVGSRAARHDGPDGGAPPPPPSRARRRGGGGGGGRDAPTVALGRALSALPSRTRLCLVGGKWTPAAAAAFTPPHRVDLELRGPTFGVGAAAALVFAVAHASPGLRRLTVDGWAGEWGTGVYLLASLPLLEELALTMPLWIPASHPSPCGRAVSLTHPTHSTGVMVVTTATAALADRPSALLPHVARLLPLLAGLCRPRCWTRARRLRRHGRRRCCSRRTRRRIVSARRPAHHRRRRPGGRRRTPPPVPPIERRVGQAAQATATRAALAGPCPAAATALAQWREGGGGGREVARGSP
ncbi:hypothetical protein BU14_0053s0029 [Porphyra umbilicalis]|uniref:Uncharacterized protein n=1 Tax=Porphyra umbilicalis TaxID=2786 RepID=A0A1X6PHT6_PORUM|nr:hypothetical protein BU14_0053s0029 [Porphyra umbilicalis]|eukprot:OSX80365.1 hypothetical protein BU14_0053s0029 [Porphyra umbilicalis]